MVICHSSTSSPSIQCNACCAAMVGCKPLDRKLGHLGQVGGKPNLCVQSILSALELLMDSVHINKYKIFCKWLSPLLNSIDTTFELICLMEHTARGLDSGWYGVEAINICHPPPCHSSIRGPGLSRSHLLCLLRLYDYVSHKKVLKPTISR